MAASIAALLNLISDTCPAAGKRRSAFHSRSLRLQRTSSHPRPFWMHPLIRRTVQATWKWRGRERLPPWSQPSVSAVVQGSSPRPWLWQRKLQHQFERTSLPHLYQANRMLIANQLHLQGRQSLPPWLMSESSLRRLPLIAHKDGQARMISALILRPCLLRQRRRWWEYGSPRSDRQRRRPQRGTQRARGRRSSLGQPYLSGREANLPLCPLVLLNPGQRGLKRGNLRGPDLLSEPPPNRGLTLIRI